MTSDFGGDGRLGLDARIGLSSLVVRRRLGDGLVLVIGNGRLDACRRSSLCRMGHAGSFYGRQSGFVWPDMGMKSWKTRLGRSKDRLVALMPCLTHFHQRPTRTRATMRPAGVAINPPMADWIRPNSIKRA